MDIYLVGGISEDGVICKHERKWFTPGTRPTNCGHRHIKGIQHSIFGFETEKAKLAG